MAQYTLLRGQEIKALADQYGRTVVAFEPIKAGAANSSYLLRTRRNKYILTVFELAAQRVERLARLLMLLEAHAFPTSRLQRLASGRHTAEFQGKPVLLKQYVSGQVVRHLSAARLSQVGQVMARLHAIPAPDDLPEKHAYGLHTFSGVIGPRNDAEYEAWLAHKQADLKRRMPPDLPRALIHGDVFYDNVLFDGDELSALIDFEEACRYFTAFDLGMAIVGLCAEAAKIRLDQARALLAGYEQVRPLGAREKSALQMCVEYAATATSTWRYWKYHLDTPTPEKADRHWQMVQIAQAVNAIPQVVFLKSVFGPASP